MSFTGSPETGRRVMEACASHLIPLHLELGGKSPQVVLRDAPLDKAIPTIARSITLNTGQICAAGSRVVVDASIRDEVVSGLADAFKQVRVGPWYEDVDMGPLISAKQEKRVLGYLESGRSEGAESWSAAASLSGGLYDRGYFVEPTIFDEVKPDMRIAQEEIFGPVLSVLELRGRGGGAADRQRHSIRARRVGVDSRRGQRRAPGAPDRGRAGVDQHAVVGRGDRGAVRRLQVERVRAHGQRRVDPRLHPGQERDHRRAGVRPVEVSLEGKVALVTGAGPNIGSGIALALARYGARVACNDVSAEAAARVGAPDRASRRRGDGRRSAT